ncbi:hypothetical protein EVAR_28245_1 [Eumeta japonica]|uniref:RNase H type-1 domain-containing protein n=1 Tax=Eumeta variegata TaxID=151549 RepID=A0A4C1V5P3_EUMVA|nr:hypothetical protein EVAR_28245_1 [Eumeta japonica]
MDRWPLWNHISHKPERTINSLKQTRVYDFRSGNSVPRCTTSQPFCVSAGLTGKSQEYKRDIVCEDKGTEIKKERESKKEKLNWDYDLGRYWKELLRWPADSPAEEWGYADQGGHEPHGGYHEGRASWCPFLKAEMVALQRAMRRVKKDKDGLVNVFSDSRLALEVLMGPKTYYSLAHEARRDISDIVAEADYDKFPLSYAKKVIRTVSLEEWQERYAEESTGEITKCFFPRVELAYRVIRRMEMTSQMTQTLTGHGGFTQYLRKFKLKESPYCACNPAKSWTCCTLSRNVQCSCGIEWCWSQKLALLSAGGISIG